MKVFNDHYVTNTKSEIAVFMVDGKRIEVSNGGADGEQDVQIIPMSEFDDYKVDPATKTEINGEDIQLLDFDGETDVPQAAMVDGKMTSITINRPDILPKGHYVAYGLASSFGLKRGCVYLFKD